MRDIWLLLDSSGLGGIESHVAELAEGLAARGEHPRVLFLADHGPHPLQERLRRGGIAWEVLRGNLLRRLRAGRPRVLHTHGYKANITGRVAARLAGIPVVASYHAGERPAGRVALWDAIDRWSSFAGRRIAVSAPIHMRLPFGGVLVPNFIAVPDAPVAAGPHAVGFVGRMVAEKAPDRFCDLAERVPGPGYLAFGDGPLAAGLRESHGGRVTFRGAVSGMEAHWREIGLLAVPSRAEGLPLAALEAMAQGVPVAAFALGGLPGLIEHGRNGYLVPPGDMDALATCVADWAALDGAARTAMAQAAWQTVRSRFGRESGVAATAALYPA